MLKLQHGEARIAVRFERGDERVDVFCRRLGAEADAQHARGSLFVEPHRAVDVAELPAVARRACRDADALRAELRDDVRRRVADKRDRENVRRFPVADTDNAVEREQLFLGIGLDGGDVGEFFLQVIDAQRDRFGKACDLPRGLRAGAQAALLPAAVDERLGTRRSPRPAPRRCAAARGSFCPSGAARSR